MALLSPLATQALLMTTNAVQDADNSERFVGFWRRGFAAYIDFLLLALVVSPVSYLVYGPVEDHGAGIYRGQLDVVILVVAPAAMVLAWWYFRQATPGKMLIGARIVDAETGNPPTLRQWLIRLGAYALSALPFMLGFLWMAFNPRKQGWHDRLAGTVVRSPR